MADTHEFSEDELDEFEESMDERKRPTIGGKNQTTYSNKPYDEAIEVSQDLSMAESYDMRDKAQKERKLKNDRYDEVVEVSQSLDQVNIAAAMKQGANANSNAGAKMGGDSKMEVKNDAKGGGDAKMLTKNNEQTRSQSVLNKPFDEALEFSQSGSEESIDTARDKKNAQKLQQQQQQQQALQQSNKSNPNMSNKSAPQQQASQPSQPQFSQKAPEKRAPMIEDSPKKSEADESEEEEEGEHEESQSYEHIEGSYNPRDYSSLNVTAEVRDLFQYIERYKPQEVELDTPLRCFIPEFIPAIGELDPFLKVPRPDKREEGSGLRYLAEPAANQSDPTVLELQLRAKSKKLQYGDVAVRSIENADKNPQKIEKWIQDINELHRSKPPPQVNYKKNMPDIDHLMEAWPEDFETLLLSTPLPSPDLELSLSEYAKALCTILDIPVYDNPIESLHLMFSLYIEFKNNPHFQSRLANNSNNNNSADGNNGDGNNQAESKTNDRYTSGAKYGGADVLEIGNDYK